MLDETSDRDRPPHHELHPLLFPTSVWVLMEDAEDGPTVYSPYPKKIRMSNQFADIIPKAAHSPRYFKTLSVGPVWGLVPRPPTRQTGTLPTELARWQYE